MVGGSGGIGAPVAVELAARGAFVTVHGAHRDRVDAAVARILEAGGRAEGLVARFGDGSGESAAAGVSEFAARFAGDNAPDILAVAFGPFVRKSLADTEAADWISLALLDLALPGALASACLGSMMERGWGRMLFFGGTRTDGIRAYRSNAAYAAAKTGIAVLVKSIAAEGAHRNVAALAICPGLVDTEYVEPAARAALVAMAPGGRLLRPGTLALGALDLLADDPCAASGAILSMDAGFAPE